MDLVYLASKSGFGSCKDLTCHAWSTGGKVQGLSLPKRVFPCATPAEVRSTLPEGQDVLAFQCRNPIHKAHYELFIRALDAPNVGEGGVCLVHPTCGPTQVTAPSPSPVSEVTMSSVLDVAEQTDTDMSALSHELSRCVSILVQRYSCRWLKLLVME